MGAAVVLDQGKVDLITLPPIGLNKIARLQQQYRLPLAETISTSVDQIETEDVKPCNKISSNVARLEVPGEN